MSERFMRFGVEIPLSLYANLDNIKNGSAASNRILEAVKKGKKEIEYYEKVYKNSVYGEMKGGERQ